MTVRLPYARASARRLMRVVVAISEVERKLNS
jgi:hypothetical protein